MGMVFIFSNIFIISQDLVVLEMIPFKDFSNKCLHNVNNKEEITNKNNKNNNKNNSKEIMINVNNIVDLLESRIY
jgi:hypothetical protein